MLHQDKISSRYQETLRDYDIGDIHYSTGSYSNKNSTKYSERFREAVKNLPRTLWRHKGIVATAVADAVEAPLSINYLENLRNVASNPVVGAGLKDGKVLSYPFRPELWSLVPHLVNTAGQTQMSPQYETNTIVSGILNLSRDPVTFGIAVGTAIAAPWVVYGIYRAFNHHKNKKAER